MAGDAEMWELDEPAPPKASKFRQSMGTPKPKLGEEATELQIGALRNCYLVRGGGVDVYKNSEDGLVDEGVSLRLRTAAGEVFTPQKALLARGEVRMHRGGAAAWHALTWHCADVAYRKTCCC